jgi:hypothetical protein
MQQIEFNSMQAMLFTRDYYTTVYGPSTRGGTRVRFRIRFQVRLNSCTIPHTISSTIEPVYDSACDFKND